MRERLDKIIKKRCLIRSRSRAQRMIEAGRVKVNGQIVTRPGHPIDTEAEIEITSYEKYVGRGGEKLEAALERFRIDVKGRVCLDIGASTGGFTDCLLQHGAARVYAIDVGHDQLNPRLRNDPRVVVREGINARYLVPQDVGEPVELVTIDVSFISLKLILPPLIDVLQFRRAADGIADALAPDIVECDIIALVKPQYEVGKNRLPADGVVKSDADRTAVLDDLSMFIKSETPWQIVESMKSPIAGEKGNIEFLIHLR
jgi:23S rRNA (cytidine1920-2'-O)/16S rRNA (cytidine1409-2'-O)-methyltransferase